MRRLGLLIFLMVALGAKAAETPDHGLSSPARPLDTDARTVGEVKLLFPGALDDKIERCTGKLLEPADEKSRTLWVRVAEDCPGKGEAVLSLKEAPRLRLECLPPKSGVRLCRAEIDPKIRPRGECLETKPEVIEFIEASERPRLCSPRTPTPTPIPSPTPTPTSIPTVKATPAATRIASRAPTPAARPSSDRPSAEARDSDRGEAPKGENPKRDSAAPRETKSSPPAARASSPVAAQVEGRPPPPSHVPPSGTPAAVATTGEKAPPPKKTILERQLPAYEPDLAPPVPTRAATSAPVAPPLAPVRTPSETKAEAASAPEKSPPKIAPPPVRAPTLAATSAPIVPPPPAPPAAPAPAIPKRLSAGLSSMPARPQPRAWSPPSAPRSVPAVRGGSLYDEGIGSPFLEAVYGYADHE